MRKTQLVIFFLVAFVVTSNAQEGYLTVNELCILNTKLKSRHLVQALFFGVSGDAECRRLKAKTIVQTASSSREDRNEFKRKTLTYSLLSMKDTSGAIKEALINEIAEYWEQKEKESSASGLSGDLSNLLIPKGFIILGESYIPYSRTIGNRKGSSFTFLLDGYAYKVTLEKAIGMGGLTTFISECLRVSDKSGQLTLTEKVTDINQAMAILSTY